MPISAPPAFKEDILIRVEGVSKKLCKDLKKSLWYGVQDLSKEMLGRKRQTELRDKEFWAVDDVSFELRRGQCLGLMGQNGAGKSTLLKMLNGLIKPDKGKITLLGRIGALIELNAGFNPILTGRENAYINGAILGFSKEEIDARFDDILAFSEIGDFIDSPVQNYSSGMRVRLGFAIASHLEPDILLVDEVLAVGDMGFRNKCLAKIKEMMQSCCVVFVSHIPTYSRDICTSILLLEEGKTIFYGDDVNEGVDMYDWVTLSEEEKLAILEKKEQEEEQVKKKQEEEQKLKEKLKKEQEEEQKQKRKDKEKLRKDLETSPIEKLEYSLHKLGHPQIKDKFKQFCKLQLKVKLKTKINYYAFSLGFSITDSQSKTIFVCRSDLAEFKLDDNGFIKTSVKFKNILLPNKYNVNLIFIGRTYEQFTERNGRTLYILNNLASFETIGKEKLLNTSIQYVGEWEGLKCIRKLM